MQQAQITFLSQFGRNKGSGVGDYCGILSEYIADKFDIQSEIRTWQNQRPIWKELVKPQKNKPVLSIQFVPFSFGRWGLFFGFLRELQQVQHFWDIHIMFHEIWIGDYRGAPLKQKLVGRIQKFLIKKLVSLPSVKAIHTSNEAYMDRLSNICDVQFLPLFGNISYLPDEIPVHDLENENLQKLLLMDRSQTAFFSFFGSIYDNTETEKRIKNIIDHLTTKNYMPYFISIGSLRSGKDVWDKLNYQFKDRAEFIELGKLSEKEVSVTLHHSDFGITTTDLDIIGKSGATLAMLEHGLQVILTETESSNKVLLNDHFQDQLIYPKDIESAFTQFTKTGIPSKKPPHSGLEETAKIFLDSLGLGGV